MSSGKYDAVHLQQCLRDVATAKPEQWSHYEALPLAGLHYPLVNTGKSKLRSLLGQSERNRRVGVSSGKLKNQPVDVAYFQFSVSLSWKLQQLQVQCADEIEPETVAWLNVDELVGNEKAPRLVPDLGSVLAELGSVCNLDNAQKIDGIREQAEEVCIEAESYLGLLVKRLPEIPLASEPELGIPDDILKQINPAALASACQLIRAILHFAPDSEADIDLAANGAVEITWRADNSLIWIVGRPSMSWPGVNVRTYSRVNPSSAKLQARSFFLAHSVVQQARTLLVRK